MGKEDPIIDAMDHLNKMPDQIYRLVALAQAMDRLGIPAAEEIFEVCETLLKLRTDASRGVSGSIAARARQATEATSNMLMACIAGAAISQDAAEQTPNAEKID